MTVILNKICSGCHTIHIVTNITVGIEHHSVLRCRWINLSNFAFFNYAAESTSSCFFTCGSCSCLGHNEPITPCMITYGRRIELRNLTGLGCTADTALSRFNTCIIIGCGSCYLPYAPDMRAYELGNLTGLGCTADTALSRFNTCIIIGCGSCYYPVAPYMYVVELGSFACLGLTAVSTGSRLNTCSLLGCGSCYYPCTPYVCMCKCFSAAVTLIIICLIDMLKWQCCFAL